MALSEFTSRDRPLRLLVLGGGRFIGWWFARQAAAEGHDVWCLHRTAGSSPVGTREILGDRDGEIAEIGSAVWDAVVDFSAYRPEQIDHLASLLSGTAAHYVLISSAFVYDNPLPGADESADLVSTIGVGEASDGSTASYAQLKVRCEQTAEAAFATVTVLRPSIVSGPGDYTMRFPTWVGRIAEASTAGEPEIRLPGPASSLIQLVDVRDLVNFTLRCIRERILGTYNIAGTEPGFTHNDLARTIVDAICSSEIQFRWTSPGPDLDELDFPPWSVPQRDGQHAISATHARQNGFVPRALAQTVADVQDWLVGGSAFPDVRSAPKVTQGSQKESNVRR